MRFISFIKAKVLLTTDQFINSKENYMKITDKTVVQFHYVLKDEAGEEIESSQGSEPLAYYMVQNNTLVGLEKALCDKEAGDKFSVTLQPEEAYGERQEDLIQRVPVKHLQGLPSKKC